MNLIKTQFTHILKTYQQMLEEEEQILQSLNPSTDWTCSNWISNYYQLFVEILKLNEDPHIVEEVNWFIFDTDFGRRDTNRKVYNSESREEFNITTPEELYDYIENNGN